MPSIATTSLQSLRRDHHSRMQTVLTGCQMVGVAVRALKTQPLSKAACRTAQRLYPLQANCPCRLSSHLMRVPVEATMPKPFACRRKLLTFLSSSAGVAAFSFSASSSSLGQVVHADAAVSKLSTAKLEDTLALHHKTSEDRQRSKKTVIDQNQISASAKVWLCWEAC
eukprot:SAG31_NODE_12560_length_932_cov_1.274910_1_plen_167_part_10